ncbi:MAG: AmmeMemoRadiSam system protein B [Proteobacteria bacterium]|nr:AmmeMemoRadiSam system protein B [Pseudomonadota bacterium]
MKTMTVRRVVLFTLFGILFVSMGHTRAESVREPAYAGSFYPRDPVALKQTIEALTAEALKTQFSPPHGNHPLKALILPHAGYPYSGLTAAHASRVLGGQHFKRIILMGPDHKVGFTGASLTHADVWDSPLGGVPIHSDSKRLAREFPQQFKIVEDSDRLEHSLEVILPFLQSYLTEFSIIPITLGQIDPTVFADDLLKVVPGTDPSTLWVASSDLSHYLPYDTAVKTDKETLDLILNQKPDALMNKNNAACGRLPILSLMVMADRYGWEPVLIHYANSGDTKGDKNKVVGYAAIAFYGDYPMKKTKKNLSDTFNTKQGKVLINLARSSISKKLGKPSPQVDIPDDPVFKARRGTFVTLKINDQLRGCIGNLSSNDTVIDGVKENALNAAFNDYRFSPLSEDELADIDIEVSILTEPQILPHKGGKDLLAKLRPKVDGVIIRQGRSGATFLPQVWEQLPNAEDFMRHLCMKAGLTADAWSSPDLMVSTYQVQYFEEKK